MRKIYEKYMMVVGCLGSGLFYVQGIKIFMDKSAEDVSLVGFTIGLVSVTSWFIYAMIIKDKVLFYSNLFAIIGASFAVIGILIYS